MAVLDATKEDWDWFEIWEDKGNEVLVYRRAKDPHHRSSVFHSMAYLDANVFEKAVEASAAANSGKGNGKVIRADVPGKEGLATAGLTGFLNKHTYYVFYNK